jgi:hypothetical protein
MLIKASDSAKPFKIFFNADSILQENFYYKLQFKFITICIPWRPDIKAYE